MDKGDLEGDERERQEGKQTMEEATRDKGRGRQ